MSPWLLYAFGLQSKDKMMRGSRRGCVRLRVSKIENSVFLNLEYVFSRLAAEHSFFKGFNRETYLINLMREQSFLQQMSGYTWQGVRYWILLMWLWWTVFFLWTINTKRWFALCLQHMLCKWQQHSNSMLAKWMFILCWRRKIWYFC